MIKDQKCHDLNPVSQFFSYNKQLLINERTAIKETGQLKLSNQCLYVTPHL